ncbi:MAG: hypothetical protein ACO1N7_09445 [Sphingobacteriaceae bacterium]
MTTIKERIIEEIKGIKDENILVEVQKLIHDIRDTMQVLQLNEKQKANIQEAREDYIAGRHKLTDDLFDDLINE